jgi:conjugal transfer pilus assembly protein TraF
MMRTTRLMYAVIFSLTLFANVSFATSANQKAFIFFYSSHCTYCHEMADILVAIAQKHKVRIIANSLDGGAIAQFPDALHNNKITRKFKITSTPTIVAVDIQKQTFELVSVELLSHKMLEAKMLAVLNG